MIKSIAKEILHVMPFDLVGRLRPLRNIKIEDQIIESWKMLWSPSIRDGAIKGDSDCPIWGELESIFSGPALLHIIIINDARSFDWKGDYPSIDSLANWIRSNNSKYKYVVDNDIIQFFV